MQKKLIRNAIIIVIFLLIPLVMTIKDGAVEGVGWNWKPADFVFAFVFLFCAGLVYELIASKLTKNIHRYIIASVIALAVVVIWVEMATGGISRML